MNYVEFKIPNRLANLISNCNSANQTRCEYCRRRNLCKEYQQLKELKQKEAEINLAWEKEHGKTN